MSDTTHSATSTPRRRFPLTLTALVGSAIAIPLYLVATAMTDDEAPVAGQTVASNQAASSLEAGEGARADEAARPEGDARKEAVLPATTPTSTVRPEPIDAPADDAAVAFDGDGPGAVPSAKPEEPAAPPPAMVGSGAAGGGDFKAKASGAKKMDALPMGGVVEGEAAPSPSRRLDKDRGGDGFAGRGDMAEIAEEAAPAAERERDDDTQQQLRAGQLTAGIIDDVTSRTSLDELRAKLTWDSAITQAIPDHGAAAPLPHDVVTPGVLEIGLVMDTTGSMGDELEYLKTELRSIAEAVATDYPGVEQRYALVAYRDHGDDYVVRNEGFATLDTFLGRLGHEHAAGGGDMPEAMDEAMAAAGQLQWTDDAAKLVFVVADAPPHTQGYQTYVKATASLADAEVSVYPVASSGIDTQCEYLMRWAARTTGGKYMFLTDHSGIGNPHAAPHVDSYELKSLRSHMLDVIRDELGKPGQTPSAAAQPIAADAGPTWYDRHAVFLWILGGMFVMGFAVDMTRAWFSLRKHF